MLLALDLGTRTGFAFFTNAGARLTGVKDFRPRRHQNWSARFQQFKGMLDEFEALEDIDHVYYEIVRRHKGTDAAHVYGGFVAALDEWCSGHDVPLAGFEVTHIKKFATGKGNANKGAMILAAEERWGVVTADDNEADALAILELARAGGKV